MRCSAYQEGNHYLLFPAPKDGTVGLGSPEPSGNEKKTKTISKCLTSFEVFLYIHFGICYVCVSFIYSILYAISIKKILNHIVQVFFLRLLTKVVLIIWQQPLRDLIIKNNKKLAPNNPSKNTFHEYIIVYKKVCK